MDPAGSHILYYYFPPSGTFSALKCWIRPKGCGALHLTLNSLWNQRRAASLSLQGVGRVGSLMPSSWAAAGAEEQRLLSCLGLGETHLSMLLQGRTYYSYGAFSPWASLGAFLINRVHPDPCLGACSGGSRRIPVPKALQPVSDTCSRLSMNIFPAPQGYRVCGTGFQLTRWLRT